MNRTRQLLLGAALYAAAIQLGGCAGHAQPPTMPSPRPIAAADDSAAEVESDAVAWKAIGDVLGREGTLHEKVYTVVVPRDDLYVTVEGMYVPTAAGIESRFNFYHCTCGKTGVLGEFVLLDYEANDVIDALRGKQFTIASLAPFLLNEHPRLVCIHFKGEGKAAEVAQVIKDALSYTGKERDAPSTNIAPAR